MEIYGDLWESMEMKGRLKKKLAIYKNFWRSNSRGARGVYGESSKNY